MRMNRSMQQLLLQLPGEGIAAAKHTAFPVWEKRDLSGRAYWGTGAFCGMDKRPVAGNTNLSLLEWDGNEVYLSAEETDSVPALLMQMMAVLRFWEKEMRLRFPKVSFFIMASFDGGVPGEEDGIAPSVTLRFWADRGDASVAATDDLERYAQPVLVQYIGAAAI